MEPTLPKVSPKAEGGLPPTPPQESEDRIFTPNTAAESVASAPTTEPADSGKRDHAPVHEDTENGGPVTSRGENAEQEDHDEDAGSHSGGGILGT
ncbi:hypothetical protein BCR34DRAFT_527025 [Clohesyomyces aquaticus]|uniref:Uncharacterized protein n=1 Tax=Clohesyomyces aquaticus TaxID=1231657 RepID=A0A1Y1Y056_9PLEO|nr:hypothetical protein BCR34DRAFT_527025 [Clohesyomyces aquaticus]